MTDRLHTGRYQLLEEVLNTLTHGLGFLLSIAGLIILLVLSAGDGDPLRIVCFAVYGTSLVLLYGASTWYHSALTRVTETKLQILDHAAIYILIAGTYTPFTLIGLGGAWGWSIFGIVWGMAILGVTFKLKYGGERFPWVSTGLYLLMGWLIIVALGPLIERLPTGAWYWIIGGGLSYTLGVVFFVWESLPYNHVIWHLFVLGGSIGHYFGVLLYFA